MTSGILLGTVLEHREMCEAAVECGFIPDFRNEYVDEIYAHKILKKLRLQIHHDARHFNDVAGIVTQIEFDDLSGRFPNRPTAVKVLKKLDEVIPDCLYRENAMFTKDLRPARPLSKYIIELEK